MLCPTSRRVIYALESSQMMFKVCFRQQIISKALQASVLIAGGVCQTIRNDQGADAFHVQTEEAGPSLWMDFVFVSKTSFFKTFCTAVH